MNKKSAVICVMVMIEELQDLVESYNRMHERVSNPTVEMIETYKATIEDLNKRIDALRLSIRALEEQN